VLGSGSSASAKCHTWTKPDQVLTYGGGWRPGRLCRRGGSHGKLNPFPNTADTAYSVTEAVHLLERGGHAIRHRAKRHRGCSCTRRFLFRSSPAGSPTSVCAHTHGRARLRSPLLTPDTLKIMLLFCGGGGGGAAGGDRSSTGAPSVSEPHPNPSRSCLIRVGEPALCAATCPSALAQNDSCACAVLVVLWFQSCVLPRHVVRTSLRQPVVFPSTSLIVGTAWQAPLMCGCPWSAQRRTILTTTRMHSL
jgi:hypothetical protein